MDVFEGVAPGVLVATSRMMSTTTTVLAAAGTALLVDPAWTPDELEALSSALQARGLRVIGGLATHAHQDHLLWHPGFGDAPRWASPRTAELARTERETLIGYLGPDFPPPLVDLMGRVTGFDSTIPASSTPPGFAPELIVHDGHVPGHTALWLPDQRVLVAGDMLSDVELPLPFHPDDLPSYRAGLDLLAGYARQARVVVPGHGCPGTDALTRLDADRRLLDDVERGRLPDDPRIGNPGMSEALDHLREMVV